VRQPGAANCAVLSGRLASRANTPARNDHAEASSAPAHQRADPVENNQMLMLIRVFPPREDPALRQSDACGRRHGMVSYDISERGDRHDFEVWFGAAKVKGVLGTRELAAGRAGDRLYCQRCRGPDAVRRLGISRRPLRVARSAYSSTPAAPPAIQKGRSWGEPLCRLHERGQRLGCVDR
jgi:hypothetical protein